jgi:hypothetical protein
MLLYHFTAIEFLDSILEKGLNRGEVAAKGYGDPVNAVWLTTDPKPVGRGLTEARLLTDEERDTIYRVRGTVVPPGARFANKRAIRITVKLSSTDTFLKLWDRWSAKRIERSWLDRLNRGGGSPREHRAWWLCFRTIEPHEFVAVEHLKDGLPNGPAAIWHEPA